jgi:hypothetical protein
MSLDLAFNLRDVAAIDRSVGAVQATKPSAKLDFDNPQGDPMQEEEPEELSEPDRDEVEDFGENAAAARANRDAPATTCTTEARIKRILDAKAEHGLPKMLKLGTKAKPQDTNYPDTPLVNKVEQKRLKAIESEAVKKKQKIEKAAVAEAVAALVQQPELLHAVS